jgi:soluble lytic murein transglycosylase
MEAAAMRGGTGRRVASLSVMGVSVLLLGGGPLGLSAKAVPLDPSGAEITLPDRSKANAGATGLGAKVAPLSSSVVSAYKTAFKFAAQKNWAAARRLTARTPHPALEKILRWQEMTQSGNRYSFSEIAEFVNRNPNWPLPNTLRNRAEEAITESTPPQTILGWFTNRPPRTTEGKVAYGRALIASGRSDEGYLHLRDAWVYGRFNRSNERRFLRHYRKHIAKSDHWERLDNLLWNGHRRQARRMLRRVSSEQRALAIARIKLRHRRGGVDAAIARVPASLLRDPGLLYERLRWRRRKGRYLDALEILKDPPANMVRPELWAKERLIVARRLLSDGMITDAHQVIGGHGMDDRHRTLFAEAEWLAGWIALRYMKRGKEAQQRFEGLYRAVQYPVSKARAAYWAGRALQSIGDAPQAMDWFKLAADHPTTYHGQLATQELGQNIKPLPEPEAPNGTEKQQFDNHELTKAVRLLSQLDQRKHVRTFLLRLSRIGKTPGHKVLAGDLARIINRLDLAVWVARYAQRDGTVFLNMAYPLYQMPDGSPERALLLAIARQESNFYPQAISHAGARGIMQLMPRTARRVARSSGQRYSRHRLTSDPVYNVGLGRRYLQQMLSKFSGSYVLAVAAYNAGPNAVSRWLRRNGDPRNGVDDPIDWIELIPFQETRTYVQRVLGNLQVFRNRLQPGRMAVTLYSDLRR